METERGRIKESRNKKREYISKRRDYGQKEGKVRSENIFFGKGKRS